MHSDRDPFNALNRIQVIIFGLQKLKSASNTVGTRTLKCLFGLPKSSFGEHNFRGPFQGVIARFGLRIIEKHLDIYALQTKILED